VLLKNQNQAGTKHDSMSLEFLKLIKRKQDEL